MARRSEEAAAPCLVVTPLLYSRITSFAL